MYRNIRPAHKIMSWPRIYRGYHNNINITQLNTYIYDFIVKRYHVIQILIHQILLAEINHNDEINDATKND